MPAKSVQLVRDIWLLVETHKEPHESDLVFFLENLSFDEGFLEGMRDELANTLMEINNDL